MSSPNDKYGIPVAKRSGKVKPGTGVSAGGKNEKTMASAKKILAEHQAVIKALSKR